MSNYTLEDMENQESIEHIREWISIMEHEPDAFILLSEVYKAIKEMLPDE